MPIAKTEKETVKLFQDPKVVFSVPLQTLAVMEPISPDGNPTTPDSSEAWSRRSGRIRVTRACDRCKK
jgi:hypothetical protein